MAALTGPNRATALKSITAQKGLRRFKPTTFIYQGTVVTTAPPRIKHVKI